jgi:Arc/MetJ-type ribon-helix-helix transcriptional regulator
VNRPGVKPRSTRPAQPVEGTASESDVLCDTLKIFLYEYVRMPKVSVEVPQELLDDLNEHVGDKRKFVNRSDAVRASIRKTLDMLDEIDRRHGRIQTNETSGQS